MVRAVSIQTGYMVQNQSPNDCILTYMAQVDPRGKHTHTMYVCMYVCVYKTLKHCFQIAH